MNTVEQLHYRQLIRQELNSSEETYCNNLEVLINQFQEPIISTGICTPQAIEGIFCNVKTLRTVHAKIMALLKVRAPEIDIATVFAQAMPMIRTSYTVCRVIVSGFLTKDRNMLTIMCMLHRC